MKLLCDHTALITGAASGIGKACAFALAREGASIAILDRNGDGAAAIVKDIQTAGGRASYFIVDLADWSAIESIVDSVISSFGHIDILVNAAGVGSQAFGQYDLLTLPESVIEATFAINVVAPFALTKFVARHMIERAKGGKIVNLSSSGAFRASAPAGHYAASKAAINALTRTSAAFLGEHNINVNAVAPGITKTPMTGLFERTDEEFARLASSGPLANLMKRVSEPEDVAEVVLFLCLPGSRQITGQVIHTSAGNIV